MGERENGRMKGVKKRSRRTETSPDLTVGGIDLEDVLQILDRLMKMFLGAQDARDGVHGLDGAPIVTQGVFVGLNGAIQVSHELGQTP